MSRKKSVNARAVIALSSSGERLHLVQQLVERWGVGIAVAARAAGAAERLDRVERLLPSSRRMTRPSAAASQRTSSWRGTSSGRTPGSGAPVLSSSVREDVSLVSGATVRWSQEILNG